MSAERFTCPRCGDTTSLVKCNERMPHAYACRPCYAEMRDEIELRDERERSALKRVDRRVPPEIFKP